MSIPVTLTVTSGPNARLVFPVRQFNQESAEIETVFDHSMASPYECVAGSGGYGRITDFMNESATEPDYRQAFGACKQLYGYKSAAQPNFLQGFNYVGTPCASCLYYDSHPGYDYPLGPDTPVYPAVSGCVSYNLNPAGGSAASFHTLTIIPISTEPPDCEPIVQGKTTYLASETGDLVSYLHLASYPLPNGDMVYCSQFKLVYSGGVYKRVCAKLDPCPNCPKEGQWVSVDSTQPIGYVGNFDNGWGKVGFHLHFEVDREDVPGKSKPLPVDPYGWWSSQSDPYTTYHSGVVNTWLWK
jgi:murein DD-endopeptidase MepM/ murein hydrolase activator NlpD